MNALDNLVVFVKENYPAYGYVITPGVEIAVDGLVFRVGPNGNLLLVSDRGEETLTLEEAQRMVLEEKAIE